MNTLFVMKPIEGSMKTYRELLVISVIGTSLHQENVNVITQITTYASMAVLDRKLVIFKKYNLPSLHMYRFIIKTVRPAVAVLPSMYVY